jgi:F-type H+-transporting ATPase subunit epsilon
MIFEGQARQVVAVGPRGEFGVLADHINLVTSLLPGILRIYKEDGTAESWVISGGLAEVRDGAMTVLAGGAQSPATIDRGQAEAEEQEASRKIASMSFYDAEYPAAEEALMLARARAQSTSASGAR